MFAIPSSAAMDAAAGGRGPAAAVLPWIVGTDPQQVLRFAADVTQGLSRVIAVVNGIDDSGRQLRQAWPSGSASDGATQKITGTIQAFQRIVTAVQTLTTQLQAVATALNLVQQAYRSVVGAANPTVATLLSNPYTHAAARSLATGTTAGLSSFVGTTKTLLDQIGMVRVIAVVTALATIAKELETLLSGDAPVPASGATANTPSVGGAITGPISPGGTPVALTGYGSGGWTAAASA